MSSHLTFYIVPKRKLNKEEKKYISLVAYSRSSDIYQYFYENINPAFEGYGVTKDNYTILTKENINLVINDFNHDIQKAQNRLIEYEKYAKDNVDYINEIIELKEYIKNLQYWRDKTSFIEDIVNDIDNYYAEIEEICCNIS